MGIYKGRGRPDQEGRTEIYMCWMCDEGHDSPVNFLWHIHTHKLEMEGQRASAAEMALEATSIVSR